MFIPPGEKNKDYDISHLADENFESLMEDILNREMYTYSLLDYVDRFDIRCAFLLGFHTAKIGYLSRGIKIKEA